MKLSNAFFQQMPPHRRGSESHLRELMLIIVDASMAEQIVSIRSANVFVECANRQAA